MYHSTSSADISNRAYLLDLAVHFFGSNPYVLSDLQMPFVIQMFPTNSDWYTLLCASNLTSFTVATFI